MKFDDDNPIKDFSTQYDEAIDNEYRSSDSKNIQKAVLGIAICVVIIISFQVIKEAYEVFDEARRNFYRIESDISIDDVENDLKKKNVEEQLNIHNVFDANFKKIYPYLEEITYAGGSKIPTFYKYTGNASCIDYEFTTMNNFWSPDADVIKFYYEDVTEDERNTYIDALENIEGYKEVVNSRGYLMYIKEDKRSGKVLYTYVIIEDNCFTYGIEGSDQ